MKASTTMTTTKPARKPATHRTGQRILAASMASAACVGLVGLVGVRAAQSSTQAEPDDEYAATTSADGYTRADLDAYAAQLNDQARQLDDYQRQLKKTAKALNAEVAAYNEAVAAGETVYVQAPADTNWVPTSNSGGGNGGGNGGGQAAPQPAPAPQPASNSHSS
jgi:hypothetical protein